jgi:hypothetical protein
VKRVSLSHETPARAPRTVPAKLASLHESDEMPGAFPGSPNEQDTPTVPYKRIKTVELPKDATPKSAAPIEVPTEEMHPKHIHQSTVKPREEARWLGFSNMAPATEPPRRNNMLVESQATPSRTMSKPENAFKSPEFSFTFRREQSLELSPEAKQLMEEKRAEALRIKGQMKSNGEAAQLLGGAFDRKIAQPKTKKSRFSELHDAAFKKMDSIANHASAYRKDPSRLAALATTSKIPAQTPSKSLKRSPSKAELDNAEATPSKTVPRASSKTNIFQSGSQLKRAPSMKSLRDQATEETSPAKRVKRVEIKEASSSRPTSSSSSGSSDKISAQPSTPQHLKESRQQPSYPNLAHLSTPTQSSLARASSVKSAKVISKIPAPSLARSPSKPDLAQSTLIRPLSKPDLTQSSVKPPEDTATILMARSPVKGGPFASNHAAVSSMPNPLEPSAKSENDAAPLLSRSPAKGGLFSRMTAAVAISGNNTEEKPKALMDAALARTPAKSAFGRSSRPEQDHSPSPQKKEPQAPLLARSPLKMSVAKSTVVEEDDIKQSGIPLLSQSPSKASQNYNPFATAATQSPAKSTGGSLIGRFNLLRSSPIKSILRTPQRLYSNDPSKIAAGTHFATPPKLGGEKQHGPAPATAPVRKHVDFSSSTKDPDALKNITSSNDSSSPVSEDVPSAPKVEITTDYPTLPTLFSPVVNPTPDRRRQTIAPGDFTFRAGDGISFGASSLAPPASGSRGSTIRHVSAEPDMIPSTIAASQKKRKFDFENKININPAELSPTVTPGSKKRKFIFENNAIAQAAEPVSTSDKENGGSDVVDDEGESRAKKRVKSVAPSGRIAPPMPAQKAASRMPTLGVKPKAGAAGAPKDEKKKSSASISMARLNALAMPKRRG